MVGASRMRRSVRGRADLPATSSGVTWRLVTDLTGDFGRIAAVDHGLVVLVTTRADGSAQASVVNAGVLANPIDGSPSVALVAQGRARKVANLRARPRATGVGRAGGGGAAVGAAATH